MYRLMGIIKNIHRLVVYVLWVFLMLHRLMGIIMCWNSEFINLCNSSKLDYRLDYIVLMIDLNIVSLSWTLFENMI
jgi:hypothetical protein